MKKLKSGLFYFVLPGFNAAINSEILNFEVEYN